jgi:hypothetical protein
MAIEDYFDKGYHIDRYHALEEDLIKFFEFMPLDFYTTVEERKRIRSTYLADLLLRIGSNIDIFFKKFIMSDGRCSVLSEQKEEGNLTWKDYKKLEEILTLSQANVKIIRTSETIYPFKNNKGKVWNEISQSDDNEFWWKSYNNVKHHGKIEEANLENVIDSLAALLLLICVKKHSVKLIYYDYLPVPSNLRERLLSGKMKEHENIIITKLFISSIKS